MTSEESEILVVVAAIRHVVLRLPMTPLEDNKKESLRKTLKDYGLLS